MLATVLAPVTAFGGAGVLLKLLWPRRRLRSGKATERHCIHCGGKLSRPNECGACGLDHDGALAGELTDLSATERQLGRFLRLAQIDDKTYQQLLDKIGDERRRLMLALPAPEPQPEPSAGATASGYAPTARGLLVHAFAAALGVTLAGFGCAYLQPQWAFVYALAMFFPLWLAAWRQGRPALHLAAAPFLVLAFSLAILQESTWEALRSSRNGWALLGPFFLAETAAWFLNRRGRADHATRYGAIGLALACLSVGLVAAPARGLENPAGAALICALTAAAGFVFNRRWRIPMIGACCCALVVAATLWTLWWKLPQNLAAWSTVLALEGLLLRLISLRWVHKKVAEGASALTATTSSLREPVACTAHGLALLALLAGCAGVWIAPAWSVHQVATALLLGILFLVHGIAEQRRTASWLAAVCSWSMLLIAGGCLASMLAELPFAPSISAALGLTSALASLVCAAAAAAAQKRIGSRLSVLSAFQAPAALAGIAAAALCSTAAYFGSTVVPSYAGALVAVALLMLAKTNRPLLWTRAASVLAWAVIVYSLARAPGDMLPILPVLAAMAPITHRTPRLLYVLAAGLQVNVVGGLVWNLAGPGSVEGLLCTQALCLALSVTVARLAAQRSQDPGLRAGHAWFDRLQVAAGFLVVALGLWASLGTAQPWIMRLWAPASLILIVPSLLLLLPNIMGENDVPPRVSSRWLTPAAIHYAVLALGLVASCQAGWAFFDPAGHPAEWLLLHRSVIALAASVGTAAAYLVLLPRYAWLSPDWTRSARNAGSILAWASVAGAAWILVLEAYCYGFANVAPMATAASAFIFALLCAQVLTALRWANTAGAISADSTNARQRYLLAAAAGVFLLFTHGRLTAGGPWWLIGLAASGLAVAAALAGQGLHATGLRTNRRLYQ